MYLFLNAALTLLGIYERFKMTLLETILFIPNTHTFREPTPRTVPPGLLFNAIEQENVGDSFSPPKKKGECRFLTEGSRKFFSSILLEVEMIEPVVYYI